MIEPPRRHVFEFLLLAVLGMVLVVSNSRITVIDDEANIINDAAAPLHQTLHFFWIGEGLHEHPPLYDALLHL